MVTKSVLVFFVHNHILKSGGDNSCGGIYNPDQIITTLRKIIRMHV
jgi:hypothetical protein